MEQLQPYMPYIVMAINGLVAGSIAALLLGGSGLLRNMLVGIIGSFLGGALVQMGLLNLPFDFGAWGNQIAVSTVGAAIIIIIAKIIAR
jgi:uncharacterized membrane protein YeaQ/YmgE (transglycosylase-associated protein family)